MVANLEARAERAAEEKEEGVRQARERAVTEERRELKGRLAALRESTEDQEPRATSGCYGRPASGSSVP